MLVYATTDDLAAWTGADAPENATGLLRSASLAVREATSLAFYATDAAGYPTDTVKRQAFTDATCCQAAALAALDIDPAAGGTLAEGFQSSVGIGSARITLSGEVSVLAEKQALLKGLCSDAQRILRNAGLTPTAPWIVG